MTKMLNKYYKVCMTVIGLMIFVACSTAENINVKNDVVTYALAERVLGKELAKHFIFQLRDYSNDIDEYRISTNNNKIIIEGNSRISLSSGLNWFLKYYTNSHISWEGKNLNEFKNWKLPFEPIIKRSSYKYSYYLNYCTFNYTMAFWDWERWEKEIDWMALNGINLSLAAVGSEIVYYNTLTKYNYTDEEIKEYIPGPAFHAFGLMGNLQGWGGPVSDSYIKQQCELQKKILKRMKDLGIEPVMPGFSGMVPKSFNKRFPTAHIIDQGKWGQNVFPRPSFIDPTDSLFVEVSNTYYQELKKIYGDLNFFSGDPFHEGGKTENINLQKAGEIIVSQMRRNFDNSVWVFQGWQGNPKKELIETIPADQFLILDLDADNNPSWDRRKDWENRNWIWCIINNYGGNEGLFGRLDVINDQVFKAKNTNKTCEGIGTIMEGIENNSIVYDFLYELKYESNPVDLNNWLKNYALRRYGSENDDIIEALQILRKTVYGQKLGREYYQQGTTESILCARPALQINSVSTWGTSKLYYNPQELIKAWRLMINQADFVIDNSSTQYDYVNLTRQVLANYAQVLLEKIKSDFYNKDIQSYKKHVIEFLELIDDQNELLETHDHFLLGNWLESAKKIATNEKEKELFEYSARVQITTWTPINSDLHEYSHREWNGLLTDFYKPRWIMFFDYLEAQMKGIKKETPDFYAFEERWTRKSNSFPNTAKTGALKKCKELFEKYYPFD